MKSLKRSSRVHWRRLSAGGRIGGIRARLEAALALARLGMAEWHGAEGWRGCSGQWTAQAEDGVWQELLHPEDRPRMEAWFGERIRAGGGEGAEIEYRLRQRDGSWHWMRARAVPSGRMGLVLLQQDIQAFRGAPDGAAGLPVHDLLTGLPGREQAFELGEGRVAAARHPGQLLAVLFLDLDGFAAVNEHHGRRVGDLVLRELGRRLPETLRSGDLAARLGDNEFLAVLGGIRSREDAGRVAENVLRNLARPYPVEGLRLDVPASIGVSLFPADGDDLETLVRHAEQAMRETKREGGRDYRFFTSAMDLAARREDALVDELREAVARGRLELHFQAVLDTGTGAVAGAEALLRWRMEDGSLLGPDAFLPVAERNGLLEEVEKWVLGEACRQGRAWRSAGLPPIPVEVNVSPLHFRQQAFQSLLEKAIADSGLDPSLLWLDVTEEALLDHIDATIAALHAMRGCGVRVTLDHFGHGWTSLGHLRHLPIHRVKVDQSLVRGQEDTTGATSIGDAILGLARSLRLEVVAEGVETREAMDMVQRRGCTRAQGNYLHRPMAGPDFMRWWQGRLG